MTSSRLVSGFLFITFIFMLLSICIQAVPATPGKNPDFSQVPGQAQVIQKNPNALQISGEHATDRLIVRYNPNTLRSKSDMVSVQSVANSQAGSKVVHDHGKEGIPGMQVVQVTDTTLESAMEAYEENPDVLYVEPDYVISLSPIEEAGIPADPATMQAFSSSYPNDPGYPSLWGLSNIGQSPFSGTPGADIDAPAAWGATTGSTGVTVAVVDTGVDYTHPDLAANIWQNSAETLNGIDDDGNGYVDDIRGWNFVSKTNNPMDDNGHGTHCAGTIAAVGNNGIGTAGVTWRSKIMPLKFLDSRGNGYTSDAISAIMYASSKGVPVISNSWGGLQSQALQDAIEASSAVVICAAGNTGANADLTPVYPAAYPSSNVISVAATDYHDQLASFSNYGSSSVDIAAPGVQIYSTSPSGSYKYLSGTSMATPYVSGVAALIKAQNPSMSGLQIKSTILNTCDRIAALSGKVLTGGRLNAAKALGVTSPTPTPTPSPTPYPTPTITRTPTPTPSQTPYPTPTITRTPTPTPSQTPYPTPTITRTPIPTPSLTPYPTPTITRTRTPGPTPYPTQQPGQCKIKKTDTKSGFLRQGQAVLYGYGIPGEGRSRIEWSLYSHTSSGVGKGLYKPQNPVKNAGYSPVSTGPVIFDIYVCKDCNPKKSPCYAKYSSYGPDPFVSITPPQSGSIYYVMVYARSGSGTFALKATSYTCPGNPPWSSQTSGQSMYAASAGDAGAGREIALPSAEYVNP